MKCLLLAAALAFAASPQDFLSDLRRAASGPEGYAGVDAPEFGARFDRERSDEPGWERAEAALTEIVRIQRVLTEAQERASSDPAAFDQLAASVDGANAALGIEGAAADRMKRDQLARVPPPLDPEPAPARPAAPAATKAASAAVPASARTAMTPAAQRRSQRTAGRAIRR